MACDAGKVVRREARAAARVERGGRLTGACGRRPLRPAGIVALIACAVVFCALGAMVVLAGGAPLGVDRAAWKLVAPLRAPQTLTAWRAISLLGTGGVLGGCAVGTWLGAQIRRSAVARRFGLALAANVALVEVLNRAVKAFFARPRPAWALVALGDYSFPSGHTMNVVAFGGLALWATWLVGTRRLPRRRCAAEPSGADRAAEAERRAEAQDAASGMRSEHAAGQARRGAVEAYEARADLVRRWAGRTLAVRVVGTALEAVPLVLVPLSRVCLGVHYASDVIAGVCLGVLWVAAYVRLVGPWVLHGRRQS